ncbi:hypothetical protein PV08_10295 [Exophiala spinifera]|uniref:Xylanolytic transcriptional activator regulatory domain-containing protein n=1 Tax=Exophiala spinifera TaxID=91928 RepID=A0A0D1Y7W0_9EURO|nr:uncharacterized protein PV08_10295 [Exophiala spinifera]KIW10996.1 hypothetical protein PV08_10295 [Exophiala spinifera]
MSSAASFLDSVRQAIEAQVSNEFRTDTAPVSARATQTRTRRLQYVLPPRKVSDELQENYWNFVYPLYPFVARKTFDQIYRSLWESAPLPDTHSHLMRLDESASMATLNLVLALGCQYCVQNEPGEAHEEAEVFFERAHALVPYDPTDTSVLSLQFVQVMLLMAQYLIGTGKSHKAWGIIGVALRACHHLGIHRIAISLRNPLNDQDREWVRRIYLGCVTLERIVCMNLGRPAMITVCNDCPTLLPLQTEDGNFNVISPSDPSAEPSVLAFFVVSTKLYDIAQQILLSFYSEEKPDVARGYHRYFEGNPSVLKLDRKLQEWCDDIPANLEFRSGTSIAQAQNDLAVTIRRQAIVLRLRYLQVRIYLFRPVFATLCVSQSAPTSENPSGRPCGEDLNYRVALQCCVLCVKAAKELIEIMHNNLTTTRSWGRKPAWLYGTLHVYLSATVLLAARFRPVVTLGAISDSELQLSWQMAMEILQSFQNDNISAQRCVFALRTLYGRLWLSADTHVVTGNENFQMQTRLPNNNLVGNGQVQSFQPTDGALSDQVALDGQEISQVFEWADLFDAFDPSDLSWLNVVPGDLLA